MAHAQLGASADEGSTEERAKTVVLKLGSRAFTNREAALC
jgi:hypothetical protein